MASVYYKLSDEVSQEFMKKVPFGTGMWVSWKNPYVRSCQTTVTYE
jgi:hypothetical protein